MPKNNTTPPERLMYPIEEARVLLGGISRTCIYEMLKDGSLRSTMLRSRRMIAREEIERVAGGGDGPLTGGRLLPGWPAPKTGR